VIIRQIRTRHSYHLCLLNVVQYAIITDVMPKLPKYHYGYPEVPADELLDLRILDVIKKPIDGVDRNPFLPWKRVSGLALRASFIGDLGQQRAPFHNLVLHFNRNRIEPQGFSLKQSLEDETFSVATVSNAPAGLATLSLELSEAVLSLINTTVTTLEPKITIMNRLQYLPIDGVEAEVGDLAPILQLHRAPAATQIVGL
jgi:hypothetical protein